MQGKSARVPARAAANVTVPVCADGESVPSHLVREGDNQSQAQGRRVRMKSWEMLKRWDPR